MFMLIEEAWLDTTKRKLVCDDWVNVRLLYNVPQ